MPEPLFVGVKDLPLVCAQDLVSTMLSGANEIYSIFNSTLGHSEKGWQASFVT